MRYATCAEKALTRDKKELGFSDEELKAFDHILMNTNGIILVTGPTGSGKSTTLYTALSELNKEDVNIITVEDPVEANIDGINQVQVNNKADSDICISTSFHSATGSDIIMIGEIRDRDSTDCSTGVNHRTSCGQHTAYQQLGKYYFTTGGHGS